MNVVNLTRLVVILREAHAAYVARGDSLNLEEEGYDQGHFLHDCGAPACAGGHWVCANPDLYEMKSDGEWVRRNPVGFNPRAYNWWGLKEDFGISENEMGELFDCSGCDHAQTAEEAANYIEGFIARKLKEESHGQAGEKA